MIAEVTLHRIVKKAVISHDKYIYFLLLLLFHPNCEYLLLMQD